jgi:hypothetical protein
MSVTKKSGTMAELAWTGPPIAPVRVPFPHRVFRKETGMYVIARKGKGSQAYVEFAQVDITSDREPTWIPNHKDPRVTRVLPQQRRGILTLFARSPKAWERCELVELDKV